VETTHRTTATWLVPAIWIAVLLLMGLFQIVFRGEIFDAAVFIGFAIALTLDARGLLGHPPVRGWAPPRAVVAAVVALGTIALTLSPRRGLIAAAVVVIAGIVMVVYGWLEPPKDPTRTIEGGPRFTRAAYAWAGIGVVLCLCELTMYFLGRYSEGGGEAYPALSDLVNPLIENPPGRAIFSLLWLLGCVALVRRGVAR
jgi:hypothetical protein